ncbi:TPA: phage tail protein [Enterococcus faecalis]|nr:phage tail protein [Enterococcus faecalis]HAP3960712.1 phage tail protein [Enterococcus faecalis]HAP4031812.1 phage tail protein [Enterococcus faecalis]
MNSVATIENKDKQLLYPIGVDDLFIAMWTQPETVTSAPVFDTEIWRLPNIVKLGIKGNGTTKEKWASNKLFTRVSRETQHELSLTHVSFPVALWDQMKGMASKNGVAFSKSTPKEMPYFALGAIGPLSNGEKSAFWYPKVQISIATEHELETTTEDIDVKDISLTMTATGLLMNDVIKSDYNSVRSTVTDMTVEKFMSEVIYDEAQLETTPPTGGTE